MIKAMDRWLLPWLKDSLLRRRAPITDVMVAVCDHFEPFHHTDKAGALRRMAEWHARLPALIAPSRDHDGQRAKHTFFYPVEQYDRDVIDSLADLCRATRNEVEIHLHHHNDTAENLMVSLAQGITDLRTHGLLGGGAEAKFGFIHGNWALDDSDPEGRGCGVRDELRLLKKAGCYADLTMPSAPHRTQAPVVNQLYYAKSSPVGCSHHRGTPVTAGQGGTRALRDDPAHLLLVQGALTLDFKRRKMGIMPRVENSDLGPQNPPTVHRMRQWLKCGISVRGAEAGGWCFVKLHTHGAPEHGHRSNIGPERAFFHAGIEELARAQGFRLHYVSARELVNILHAAEDGRVGDAGAWRDYVYAPPPLLRDAVAG